MANLEFLVPLNLGFAFTLLQTIQPWVERENVEQSFLYKETTQWQGRVSNSNIEI